jgi:hypothetical protein
MAGRAHSRHLDALDDKLSLRPMKQVPHFEIVCCQCEAPGVHFDRVDGAPSSVIVKCSACGAPRGTLGALQSLAQTSRRDLFDA